MEECQTRPNFVKNKQVMDKQIHTEIIINAPLQKVWQIIIQLEDYKNWNPILIECRGIAKTGQRLKNVMRTKGSKTMSFNPIVTKVEEDQYFEWLGSLLVKGIFDGRHSFRLTEISPEQVRLVHREEFSGIASGFILKKIKEQTTSNFILWNQALKAHAEEKNTER